MINGTLLLDKPKNITSNGALRIVKKELSVKKAGIVGILEQAVLKNNNVNIII